MSVHNRIVRYVELEALEYKLGSPQDDLAYRVILYNYIQGVIGQGSNDGIRSLVSKYKHGVLSNYKEYSERMVSYSTLIEYINSQGINSLNSTTTVQRSRIQNIYLDKREKVSFSTVKYDPLMYLVTDISLRENQLLSKIHTKIMVPLVREVAKSNDVSVSDIEIVPLRRSSLPIGKEITFRFKSVTIEKLFRDVAKSIIVKNNTHEVNTDNEFITIKIK